MGGGGGRIVGCPNARLRAASVEDLRPTVEVIPPGAAGAVFFPTEDVNKSTGLDPELVQAFPTFYYLNVKEFCREKYDLECAICLGGQRPAKAFDDLENSSDHPRNGMNGRSLLKKQRDPFTWLNSFINLHLMIIGKPNDSFSKCQCPSVDKPKTRLNEELLSFSFTPLLAPKENSASSHIVEEMSLETISLSNELLNVIIYDTIFATPCSSHDHDSLVTNCFSSLEQAGTSGGGASSCLLMVNLKRRSNVAAVQGRKKTRRKPRVCKNKEEAQTQRITHIAVERNRR
ncbi:hypothetical protein F3Y22_tig00110602pilonHSYRG00136 [Hibiscus syriacus]|uniref:Uncharacterized protein n=1 Tax=Hibiscus syriacus TaxID=106335 RepID=A0A6A3A381_HIBSY|nr:hypothetical protein F3Y22_tig00110602pilonHSYRG00136 [Hibiscus syriacus]